MLVLLALAAAQPPAPPAPELPAWLAGCWRAPMGAQGTLTETWLGPVSGVMVGAALGGARGGAPVWEHLRLEVLDGKLTLFASPSGQASTAFPATSRTDRAVVFENPAHDFPQRITYTRTDAGVIARVESREGEGWKGFTLEFARCQE